MNILSFDIEEWWIYKHNTQFSNFEESLPRLDRFLDEILDLLDSRNFKATFFCLGDVARNYPHVVKKIALRGHHVGCHSNVHSFLGNMTPEDFAEDTKLAIRYIEDATGTKVNAYRAPAFSVTSNTLWAIEILADLGIEYDCSIFPANHRFGGFPEFKVEKPLIIKHKTVSIKEFPISLTDIIGKRIAFSGGGYFRFLPYSLIDNAYRKHDYTMAYFHIRDFDNERARQVPISKMIKSPINYFKNFYGIPGAYSKFQKLLLNYDFLSLEQAAKMIDWQNVTKVEL